MTYLENTTNEALIRLSFFLGTLILMSLWEMVTPHRQLLISKRLRWFSNLSLVVLNTLILRAIFPLAAVGASAIASSKGWGLFNVIAIPQWQSVLLSVIALDLIIYFQHVIFHTLPMLWQLHKVHHCDRDFDVTTGLRFHPIEILLSMGFKIITITLLGAPPTAVIIFEILLNSTSLFNHGNVGLPPRLDRLLRLFIVTPDMHRIHHSIITKETNSNFGLNLPWWDYLFGTYRAYPEQGQQEMTIGLAEYQNTLQVEQLPWMLLLPFMKIFHRSQT
jgi:sterol desaturase/sphingolipid hydroxylase (fatty acid hydroxylase superfamily)